MCVDALVCVCILVRACVSVCVYACLCECEGEGDKILEINIGRTVCPRSLWWLSLQIMTLKMQNAVGMPLPAMVGQVGGKGARIAFTRAISDRSTSGTGLWLAFAGTNSLLLIKGITQAQCCAALRALVQSSQMCANNANVSILCARQRAFSYSHEFSLSNSSSKHARSHACTCALLPTWHTVYQE